MRLTQSENRNEQRLRSCTNVHVTGGEKEKEKKSKNYKRPNHLRGSVERRRNNLSFCAKLSRLHNIYARHKGCVVTDPSSARDGEALGASIDERDGISLPGVDLILSEADVTVSVLSVLNN